MGSDMKDYVIEYTKKNPDQELQDNVDIENQYYNSNKGSASQNFGLLEKFYQSTMKALEEAKNEVRSLYHSATTSPITFHSIDAFILRHRLIFGGLLGFLWVWFLINSMMWNIEPEVRLESIRVNGLHVNASLSLSNHYWIDIKYELLNAWFNYNGNSILISDFQIPNMTQPSASLLSPSVAYLDAKFSLLQNMFSPASKSLDVSVKFLALYRVSCVLMGEFHLGLLVGCDVGVTQSLQDPTIFTAATSSTKCKTLW